MSRPLWIVILVVVTVVDLTFLVANLYNFYARPNPASGIAAVVIAGALAVFLYYTIRLVKYL